MNKNTIGEYIKALKAKYEEAKSAEFSSFLLNPSPAELKILCLLLFDNGISKQDQEIVDIFFDLNDESSKRKQMEYFDADKLKPIGNFLKGKTETTRVVNLDLIAFLVDFNPRPYRKFMSGKEMVKLTADFSINESSRKDKKREVAIEKSGGILEEFKMSVISKRMVLVVLALLVCSSVSYGVKNIFFPNKNCIVWVENHYEAVECDKGNDALQVYPFNQELLDNFKKISVCDTTTFFKNEDTDNPVVWYGKAPDKKGYEYFNQPGLHPETRKTLKPISKYIIGKYILKEE